MSLLPDFKSCPPTKVMIVDDHQAVVEMMVQAVESIANHRVVGIALDAGSAREICRREQPDILVLDLIMPHVSGLSLLNDLKEISPEMRVVIFSGYLRPAAIREGLAAGVFGFVEKIAPLRELRAAIIAAGEGQPYFDAKTSQTVRTLVRRRPGESKESHELTQREKAVLRLLAQGHSSKEIARTLGISIHTVINHRSNLMKKTGLRRVAQLSLYAAEVGLVGSPGATPLV